MHWYSPLAVSPALGRRGPAGRRRRQSWDFSFGTFYGRCSWSIPGDQGTLARPDVLFVAVDTTSSPRRSSIRELRGAPCCCYHMPSIKTRRSSLRALADRGIAPAGTDCRGVALQANHSVESGLAIMGPHPACRVEHGTRATEVWVTDDVAPCRWKHPHATCAVEGCRVVRMVVATQQRAVRPPAEPEGLPMDWVAKKECSSPALTCAGTRVRPRPGSRWLVRRSTSLQLSCDTSLATLFRMRNARTGRRPAEWRCTLGRSKTTVITVDRRDPLARSRLHQADWTLADELQVTRCRLAKMAAPYSLPPTTTESYHTFPRSFQ